MNTWRSSPCLVCDTLSTRPCPLTDQRWLCLPTLGRIATLCYFSWVIVVKNGGSNTSS